MDSQLPFSNELTGHLERHYEIKYLGGLLYHLTPPPPPVPPYFWTAFTHYFCLAKISVIFLKYANVHNTIKFAGGVPQHASSEYIIAHSLRSSMRIMQQKSVHTCDSVWQSTAHSQNYLSAKFKGFVIAKKCAQIRFRTRS